MLGAGAAQVDASRFDALVSHEVGKERYVVELLQKVLGETMPERVRVNNRRIQLVFDGEFLQLGGNAPRRNAFAAAVDEEETRSLVACCEPRQRLVL